MTEDQRKIMFWRNEQHKHCMFSSQSAYDESSRKLKELKQRVLNKELCNLQVIATELVLFHGYGNQQARELANKWWEEAYG